MSSFDTVPLTPEKALTAALRIVAEQQSLGNLTAAQAQILERHIKDRYAEAIYAQMSAELSEYVQNTLTAALVEAGLLAAPVSQRWFRGHRARF
jgi:hypothetical protein